ncbi:MAG: Carbohydrate binding domain protein [Chloroflexi bacterium ADurb.Bin344]|nr:MAG: Carbohydrate binding domain protein [Chloroflexi bacterium ADurb.Bin344]
MKALALSVLLVIGAIDTYAQENVNLVKNPGFENCKSSDETGCVFIDWATSPHNFGNANADETVKESGKTSLIIHSVKKDKHSIVQVIDLVPGKTYEFSGVIRTEGKSSGKPGLACIGIWSRSLSRTLSVLEEKNPNSGKFKRYSARFTVPEGSTENALSCNLSFGTDKAWFDDISIVECQSGK